MSPVKDGALDLEACENEPLHHIGALQAPYAMAVFCPGTGKIDAASRNLPELCGIALDQLNGLSVEALFEPVSDAPMRFGAASVGSRPARLCNGRDCTIRLHDLGGHHAVVIDPASVGTPGMAGLAGIVRFNALIEEALAEEEPDIPALADVMATVFRELSGFDRVMVYRFDADWNGAIIAEAADPVLPSRFIGLTFPSSDIPRMARQLFLTNRVRPLVDVSAEPVPLEMFGAAAPESLDLGAVPERAVSPIHLAYLRNMGVQATLTIALLVNGQLWGLLTCHHYAGRRQLSPAEMDLCRVVCDLLSHGLSRIAEHTHRDSQYAIDSLARSMRNMAQDPEQTDDPATFYAAFEGPILSLLGASGAQLGLNGKIYTLGTDPGPVAGELRAQLLDRFDRTGERQMVTNHVVAHAPELADRLLPGCAGVAMVRHESDMSVLAAWRPASERLETWAGDPEKRVSRTGALSPRDSFERWQAMTMDKCLPWPAEQAHRANQVLAVMSEVGWTIERRRAERLAQAANRRAEEAKAALEHSALHDALTDLPNRRYLESMLSRLAPESGGGEARVAALHVALDRFRVINDTLGRTAGDSVLQHVSRTLRRLARENDFLARIGGDEFVLIARDRLDEATLTRLSADIITELARPMSTAGQTLQFGASIGIAYAPRNRLEPEALLTRADIALAEAKRNGRGRFCFVSDELEQQRLERRNLGEDIMRGFAAREFELYFQLQFDARTRDIVGAEALLRWHHPTRGTLSPPAFLDAAEDMGVIEKLDALAVDDALAAQARWAEAGLVVPKVSVNISASRLKDMDVAAMIQSRPQMRGVIAFELLESMDLDNLDTVTQWNIDRAKDAGIALEIDDFGTGHTSILSLVRLKPKRIKIDRNLVFPIVESETARDILASIVAIARSLEIGVTAEGVETERHAEILAALGCDTLQGYALAMPLSADAILSQHALGDTG